MSVRAACLLAAVTLAAGCPAPLQYREVRPGLSCERATRVAHRALVELGYTVTDLVVATPVRAGVVAGRKTQPDGTTIGGRVVITCDGQAAQLQPVEDGLAPTYEFSRGFGYSFKTLVQRPDVEEPQAASGLQVQVRALTPQEATLDLGGVPTLGGAVAVRVTVRNHTDRPVAIDPARVALVPAGGASTAALAGEALDAAIAPGPAGERVRGELLRGGRVAAGATESGFLVYPPGVYREAQVGIEDVETGESEGFVTRLQ